jgi:hypothetical protein
MGMYSYFVCATAVATEAATGATAVATEVATGATAAATGATEASIEMDPRDVTFQVERMSNWAKSLFYNDVTVVSLHDVGRAMHGYKLWAYVDGENKAHWRALLLDLHAQHPTLLMRLHFWYEEDLMFFFQVTPDADTSLHVVHALACHAPYCCGYDCRDAVSYFVNPRAFARRAYAWQESDEQTWPLEAAKEVALRVCEGRELFNMNGRRVDETKVASDLMDPDESSVRYLCPATYLRCAEELARHASSRCREVRIDLKPTTWRFGM